MYETDQIETVSISGDGGKSWRQIPLPKPLGVYDLAIQPGGDGGLGYLYLATDDGLWVYPHTDPK